MNRIERTTKPEQAHSVEQPHASVSEPNHQEANSKETLAWRRHFHQRLLKILDLSLISSLQDKEARLQIREILQKLMNDEGVPLSATSKLRVIKQVEDEVLGLGPLEPVLADPSVADILVNGAGQVYVERRGKLELTDVCFDDNAHLLNIIDRIVSRVGRRIDESSPMVDARLEDGSRVNAVVPPLAIDGPLLAIRRFSVQPLTIDDLTRLRTLSPVIAEVLRGIVRARLNVLVSGGTGSGKTTLLNVLSSFIPASERIVTIEDSAELRLQQPHVVRLETRPPNIEGKGEVTQRDLVRNSLRMRPDRIIVGEVRGSEALDMLQAMNTGHDGSLTTIHANNPRDALSRIESMVAMTGLNLPIKAVRAQMASAIDVVVQVERHEDGHRRLISVQEINGMEGDIITMSEIFSFRRHGIDEEGNVTGSFQATGIVPKLKDHLVQRGVELAPGCFDNQYSHQWEDE